MYGQEVRNSGASATMTSRVEPRMSFMIYVYPVGDEAEKASEAKAEVGMVVRLSASDAREALKNAIFACSPVYGPTDLAARLL